MALYERRPERDTVEAFRVGDEPPEWFAKDKWGRWRPVPGDGRGRPVPRYVIRRWSRLALQWEWEDAPDGSYVVHNGPEEQFTLVSAERFAWLYRGRPPVAAYVSKSLLFEAFRVDGYGCPAWFRELIEAGGARELRAESERWRFELPRPENARLWRPIADGDFVFRSFPYRSRPEVASVGAASAEDFLSSFETLGAHADWLKNISAGATKIDAPASETAHSGGPTGEHTA
jgi:hypothetical protein